MDNKRDTYFGLRGVCSAKETERLREGSWELRAEVFAPLFQLQLLLPLPLALPLHFRSPSRFTTEIPGPNRKNPSNSKGNQHGAGGGGVGGGGSGGVGNADTDANDILKLKQQVKVTYQPEDDELYGSSEDFDDGELAGLPPLSPHHYYTSGNKPPTHKPGGGQHHHHSQQSHGGSGADRERERGGGGGGVGGNIELAFGNTRKPTYYGGSGVAGGVGAASAAGGAGGIASGGGGIGGMDNAGVRHGGPMDNNKRDSGCASLRHAAAWRQPLLMGLFGLVAALRLL